MKAPMIARNPRVFARSGASATDLVITVLYA